jgi:CheY-like chemotaxis protein
VLKISLVHFNNSWYKSIRKENYNLLWLFIQNNRRTGVMEDKKVVLAIDDNVQQLSEFKAMLGQKYDLRVVKAASEAIAYLNRNSSDVILLDIEMPNISGFEFLEDIRKIPSYLKVPIIIVSGNSGHEFFKKASEYEASAVLTKPVNPEKLIETIEKAYAEAKNPGKTS